MKTVSGRQNMVRANQNPRARSRLDAHLHFDDRFEREDLCLCWFYMNSVIWTHDTFPLVLQKFVSIWDVFAAKGEELIRKVFSIGCIPRSVRRTIFWSTGQLQWKSLVAVFVIYFQRACNIKNPVLSFVIFTQNTVACIYHIFGFI